ncbi:hypothetical protein CVT24_003510, partial [Panaeolus cyanescens]
VYSLVSAIITSAFTNSVSFFSNFVFIFIDASCKALLLLHSFVDDLVQNITTYSDALRATLPHNYSQPLPTVIRPVDRCWCDFSNGLFEPFNATQWDVATVYRLKRQLDRQNASSPASLLNTDNDATLNTTTTVVDAPPKALLKSLYNSLSTIYHLVYLTVTETPHSSDASERQESALQDTSTNTPFSPAEPTASTAPFLRKKYDLRPYGLGIVIDLSCSELPHRSNNARTNQNSRPNLSSIVTDSPSSSTQQPTLSKFEIVHKAIMAPFSHKKNDSTRILSDLAPVIMTPRMISSAATVSSRPRSSLAGTSGQGGKMGFSTLGRAPLRLGLGSKRITSGDLQIFEATEELLEAEVPEPEGVASNVSLLRGFNATIPSAEQSRTRRRQMRNVDTPKLGLKKIGLGARGLLTEEDEESQSVASEEDVVLVKHSHGRKKKGRESLSTSKMLGKEELTRQTQEILKDKENVHVKRSLINSEIEEITHKIQALDGIRAKLEQNLLKLQEDELELDDELEGIKERLRFEESSSQLSNTAVKNLHLPSSSRRRKGPAFLPSEHDELPPGVAFISLDSHTTPITALDFSEPYGTLVSASQDDAQPRVWDLLSGEEIGRLRGHVGAVRCLQVEDSICLTGGVDGNVRMWDLRKVDEDDGWGDGEMVTLSDVAEEEEEEGGDAQESASMPSAIRNSEEKSEDKSNACVRLLEGHTQAVTALYFEDECLVTGASDKTLRQWDLTTGQCVMTMDILWAISHPSNGAAANPMGSQIFPGSFSVLTPPYADGTRETYEDFVGGVQFWGYGLVSGSGDGAVRMWDMRTGQAHRTLLGHTGPITCLQFDELHIASGSLDKTLKVWDLRTGSIFETIQFDHAVTALQFDSRKIIAATGENGVKVYNRTSSQKSTLLTNGHTRPVERLRYMDRYLVTGGRDAQLKIWSL